MIKEQLLTLDIFKDLSDEHIQKVADITIIETYSDKNILFYEGEEPNYFYGLIQGRLKLYKTGIKSNEIVLHYFITPTMVAEMASLENINFPATAQVQSDDTKIALINKDKFLSLLKNDPELSFHIIKSLTKKIKNLEVAINRNLIFDATTKVCSYIDEHPDFFANTKKVEVAKILNMAPETLSRVLGKLKSLEILDKDHNLIDSQKLKLYLEF